jgi:hypothetical protein
MQRRRRTAEMSGNEPTDKNPTTEVDDYLDGDERAMTDPELRRALVRAVANRGKKVDTKAEAVPESQDTKPTSQRRSRAKRPALPAVGTDVRLHKSTYRWRVAEHIDAGHLIVERRRRDGTTMRRTVDVAVVKAK